MMYFDLSSGAAGDMLVASLLDLGADFEFIQAALAPVAGVSRKRVTRAGVKAMKFNVKFSPESRQYADLVKLVKGLNLSRGVESLSLSILEMLARAEARVHETSLTRVHLHEAVDCVVDAVAFSIALEDMGLIGSRVVASPVAVGFIAPATQAVIKANAIPVVHNGFGRELFTPTGAAILAATVKEYTNAVPDGKVGYGAGSMNLEEPNVVKAVWEVREKSELV